MKLFRRATAVRVAQAQVLEARHEVAKPASALLARGHEHPLSLLGVAAGTGFVLGRLDVHPLRVPGLGSVLSGGFAQVVAQAVSLVAELGVGAGGDGTS